MRDTFLYRGAENNVFVANCYVDDIKAPSLVVPRVSRDTLYKLF